MSDIIVANRIQELDRTLKRILNQPKFEYKVIQVRKEEIGLSSFDSKLKDLGEEGWELVSVSESDSDTYQNLIFKRRRP
jgi:hypothetical protein